MSRKFKQALHGLKDTYPTPDPERRDAFLASLPQKKEEKHRVILPFLHIRQKPLWYALPSGLVAAVMLAAGIGAYRHHQKGQIPAVPMSSTTVTTAVTTTHTQTVTEMMRESTSTTISASLPAQTTGIAPMMPSATSEMTGSTPVSTAPAATTQPFAQTTGFQQGFVTLPSGTANTATARTTPSTTASRQTTASASQGTTASATGQTTRPVIVTTDPLEPETTTVRHSTTTTVTARTETKTSPENDGNATDSVVCTTALPTAETEYPTETPTDAPVEEMPVASESSFHNLVTPAVTYTPGTPLLERRHFFSEDTPQGTADAWWEPMADSATEIFTGTVLAVWYTDCNGVPYMQLDVEKRTSYRETMSSQQLSVYLPGGYMPLTALCGTYDWAAQDAGQFSADVLPFVTVHETATSQKMPEAGDVCLFFVKAGQVSGIPGGAFQLVATDNLARLYPAAGSTEVYVDASGQYTIDTGRLRRYCAGS